MGNKYRIHDGLDTTKFISEFETLHDAVVELVELSEKSNFSKKYLLSEVTLVEKEEVLIESKSPRADF